MHWMRSLRGGECCCPVFLPLSTGLAPAKIQDQPHNISIHNCNRLLSRLIQTCGMVHQHMSNIHHLHLHRHAHQSYHGWASLRTKGNYGICINSCLQAS